MFFHVWIYAAEDNSRRDVSQFHFRHLKQEDGLTQNTVWCILQDDTGFIWFGTKDGLNRFDGHEFRSFRSEPSAPGNGIGDNFIRALHEDGEGRIWAGTNSGVYIYDPKTESFSFFGEKADDGTVIEKEVNDIKSDKSGNIWIGNWQGLFKYNTISRQLFHFGHDPNVSTSLSSNQVLSVCVDSDNIIWAGTLGGGINRYQPATNDFISYDVGDGRKPGDVYTIIESDVHSILLGTSDRGILVLDRTSGKIEPYIYGLDQPLFVRELAWIKDSELWIGTESGLYVYNTGAGLLQKFTQNTADQYSLSDNAVYSIYKDRDGNVWVGTYFGGVNCLSMSYPFEKWYHIPGTDGINGNAVREFQEDAAGNLWIGTEDAGLFYFDVSENRSVRYAFRDKLKYHNIHALLLDGETLWIGYFSQGLDMVDLPSGNVTHFSSYDDGGELSDDSVFSLYKDRRGNIWIGTTSGLDVCSPETGGIHQVPEVGRDAFIYDIIEDSNGIIWFATYNDGIFRYNPRIKKWWNSRNVKGDSTSLGYDKVIGLFEDSSKRIWVSTEGGGVSVWLPEEECFRTYTVDDGLPNDVVYKILEDEAGNIWITTNRGLACMNARTGKFRTYTQADGLLTNQFNYKSGIKTGDGKLYFGSINGLIGFRPEKIIARTEHPSVVLTGFSIFDDNVEIGSSAPLKQSITFTDRMKLKHYQNSFSFDVAILNYGLSEPVFAYKLENHDKDWNIQKGNYKVSYFNIRPGRYSFRAGVPDGSGKVTGEGVSIEIIVRPPFYSSFAGIMTWIFLSGILLYRCHVSYKKRMRVKHIRNLKKYETEKEKLAYKSKVDFFTNIAHEIRTPLTLIAGPYAQILKGDLTKEDYDDNLEIMGSNINRLMNLTNQFLDFREVEKGGFALDFTPVNINDLLSSVLHQFKIEFKLKGLEVQADFVSPQLIVMADKESLIKIFTNLIGNASKFAEKTIIVKLQSDIPQGGFFSVIIKNDGRRIQPENREHVFDIFFREQQDNTYGTGIGLPLVRHLVSLHKGRVYLDESDTMYNTFIVELPALEQTGCTGPERPDETEARVCEHDTSDVCGRMSDAGKQQILIVEDDAEMRVWLKKILSDAYGLYFAVNGKCAMEIMERECIDLVLSDVMMPGMDGISLCRYIKTHPVYSYIPVVLLTAKTNLTAKIAGIEAKADAYIEKPFSSEYLLAYIDNLFSNKDLLKNAFSSNPLAYQNNHITNKSDEEFLEKINQIILEHLDDENFSIDQLADLLNVSRSTLHRRIKEVTSLTPNDFIRFIRLKKAAELIGNNSYRINEVCYAVGFKSPSYFSKCFYRQFGVLPKDFVKKG